MQQATGSATKPCARRDRRGDTEKASMSSSQGRTARMAAAAGSSEPTRRLPDEPGLQEPEDSAPRREIVEAPLVLDRYRLHRRLGAGAFGTVWMARDERLERDVAVKLLARERIVGGRFEREARAAARLSHPGIVTLYEAAVDDEGAYLVSELVRGTTLDALLASGRLSDQDIVAIAIALCDALGHAHAEGVVHRDVKPSNILIPDPEARSRGAAQAAKLTDFGVARLVDSDALTGTGDVLGTLAYMAPEQAEGLEAGAPADLYSLALVVYEALTGINPVESIPTRPAFQRARRLGAHLPPLRRQRRDLPVALGRAIDTALRPRVRERGSLAELRYALESVHAEVGAEPGIVTGPWSRDPADDDEPEPFTARAPERPPDVWDAESEPLGVWTTRGLGAVTAAAFAAWTVARLPGAGVALPVAAVALIAGIAVLLLPRLGWGALVIAVCVSALARHDPGAALAIAIAGLLPVVLLALRPTAWPLSATAPALGMIGLAGAWPAIASRARGAIQRAALGAIGWVWVLLAGALTGRVLYLPHVPGVPGPTAWTGSLHQTTAHLLSTYVSSGALLPAPVWALGAMVLPWLVHGRALALDVFRVVVWSTLLVCATSAAVLAAHGSDAVGAPPTAILGAAAGAAVALAPPVIARWRHAPRLRNFRTRLP
jgi:hypothetical protein